MKQPCAPRAKLLLGWIAFSLLLTMGWAGWRVATDSWPAWHDSAVMWALLAGLLLLNRLTRSYPKQWPFIIWPWPALLVAGLSLVTATLFAILHTTWAAGLLCFVFLLLLQNLDTAFTGGRSLLGKWAIRGFLALTAGMMPVLMAQVEADFAEEEFFVGLQVLVLVVFWLATLSASYLLDRQQPAPKFRGCELARQWLLWGVVLANIGGLYVAVRAYQSSFYTQEVPGYKDVSAQAPFVCGKVSIETDTYDGVEVFHRLLHQVAKNPQKGPPEYGMLALGTHDEQWAQVFRRSLLEEARARRYTSPAQSMKSIQYEAALRAYYYPRVKAMFPGAFSDDEVALLRDWFAAINRRALTVEWVDWFYSLAFTKWPEGPYENQEIGAGLLALLEHDGLADPSMSSANQDYLRRNPRGWTTRFRNTDDVYAYQIAWLQNAFFQSLYTDEGPNDNVRRSFEWLLYQALPDGTPLRYNHPDFYSVAGVAYMGATLLNDPRYIWLAGRAVEEAEKSGRALFAQPGAEIPIALVGRAPSEGSCLLYGDSGLPNQIGPLAPDKIVLRDGWAQDASYLLLNLRFSGWHRYKATNTVTLVYKGGPLASDVLSGESFTWLPEGRSLFRDKRIPRENLNGLLVPKIGLSAVLYNLTGIGGRWAQDPPRYAEVLSFEPGTDLDRAHTRLLSWRGWQQDRWIALYHHGGPIVVLDQVIGPTNDESKLVWHLNTETDIDQGHLQLRGSSAAAEVIFLPITFKEQDKVTTIQQRDTHTVANISANGQIHTATVFLFGSWMGAEVLFDSVEQTLRIVKENNEIVQPLPWETD